jgi:RimJ/RimL family protein N-acetyltransferase
MGKGETPPMEIRKATIADIPNISRIHALTWKAAYQGLVPQTFLDELKEDNWTEVFTDSIGRRLLTVQLIFDGGKPAGCISYGKSRDNGLPDWGEVVSFYLLPQYWGKGYAKLLMDTAMADLSRNFRNVYLWVLKENKRARRFYEKNHFRWNNEEAEFELQGQKLADVRYVYSFRNMSLKI